MTRLLSKRLMLSDRALFCSGHLMMLAWDAPNWAAMELPQLNSQLKVYEDMLRDSDKIKGELGASKDKMALRIDEHMDLKDLDPSHRNKVTKECGHCRMLYEKEAGIGSQSAANVQHPELCYMCAGDIAKEAIAGIQKAIAKKQSSSAAPNPIR